MSHYRGESIRLVILDRDGVININSQAYVKSAAEWHPIAGSLEAVAQLKEAGFLVAIATNQSGIGRGYYTKEDLYQIHQKLTTSLAKHNGSIDHIEFCPHAPEEDCVCRKPKPTMLATIGKKLNVPPSETIFIGDSLKDIEAGRSYGCDTILVRTGYGIQTERQLRELGWQVPILADLQTATQYIIENTIATKEQDG